VEAHQQLIGDESVLGGDRMAHRAIVLARRSLDLVGACLALLVLAPLVIAILLAVRIDSGGPALFRQRRLGRDKQPFTLLKFRTMYVHADEQRHRDYVRGLIGAADVQREGGGLYKLHRDDRVTRVGRFLRHWSLDELPQLWNVVRGEMSLAGPRPVLGYEVDIYPSWYEERFAVKPGITGLWQVSGRNERTYEEMVRLDIEYVRRQSLRLDLSILFRTVWTVLSRRGAA
jgi:lipopolysaccharide/colanic/teichoic acid biosynthesis glycosyltransferase